MGCRLESLEVLNRTLARLKDHAEADAEADEDDENHRGVRAIPKEHKLMALTRALFEVSSQPRSPAKRILPVSQRV